DPVENASLIPWLFGTVLIHGLHMERTKGRYRRANYVLAALVYLSVLYGTFLTRSGVLADFSVHSFVDLGISGWLVALMGSFFALSVWLLATRLRQVPTKPNEDPFLSRGTFMVLSTITVLVCAVVITFGTSAPLITRWFMENPAQVGPTWYNKVNLPIALLIALLLALVPYLTWRGDDPKAILRKLIAPGLFALTVTVAAAAWQVQDPFHLLFVFLASLALATNLHKTVARGRAAGVAAAGGYLAHVGVGVILLGFLASSGYDESTKITLQMGTPKKLGDTTLTFTRFIPRDGREKEKMEIEVAQPGRDPFFVYPKLFVNDRTRQVMANPDIRSTPFQDLYVSPIDFDPGQLQVQLAQGESGRIGGMDVRFLGFDVQPDEKAQMAAGGTATVGAMVEVTQNGKPVTVRTVYRLNQVNGAVETPPVALPGGGSIFVSGLNPSDGTVQFQVSGVSNPAKLSIDVTRKPLIQLVWYGLYIVLIGGAVATFNRLRQVRRRETVLAQVQE
ncbi:MAG TPA: cytochrome c-type biogenesis CcmF C-terminal domain-containing protein, partial [Thermoanaerobaculia bacterium]|nr:cytochrome c-type biogenesis CcmF C-terminal domain-containing protein [Thermoanaerobaculia bacterium]